MPRMNMDNKRYHPFKCKCFVCQHGKKALQKVEIKSMKKYGWYAHLVFDDCDFPNHTNFHTHGVYESFGHLDFQCCFPFPDPNILMTILHAIVNDIKGGRSFIANVGYDGYIQGGYLVRFMEATENDRIVLRLLVPNAQGTYEGGPFAEQLRM